MSEPNRRYDDLRALFINGTLKRSPEPGNTQGLIDASARIMTKMASTLTSSGPPTMTSPRASGRT